jgi:hypothetical protein
MIHVSLQPRRLGKTKQNPRRDRMFSTDFLRA